MHAINYIHSLRHQGRRIANARALSGCSSTLRAGGLLSDRGGDGAGAGAVARGACTSPGARCSTVEETGGLAFGWRHNTAHEVTTVSVGANQNVHESSQIGIVKEKGTANG